MSETSLAAESTEQKPFVPELSDFLSVHGPQFETFKIPALLRKYVHKKLYNAIYMYDEGNCYLKIEKDGSKTTRAAKTIKKNTDVYLVPHILIGTAKQLFEQIYSEPKLLQRLWEMMNLDDMKLSEEDKKLFGGDASSVLKTADIPEELIEQVAKYGDVTNGEAVRALKNNMGDFILSVLECQSDDSFIKQQAEMNKKLFQSFEYEGEKHDLAEIEQEIRTRKTQIVLKALFERRYVEQFISMDPRGPDSPFTGPPDPSELRVNYVVKHEIGSHIPIARKPAEANCNVFTFVCTQPYIRSWSLVIPTKDLMPNQVFVRNLPPPLTPPSTK